MLIGARIFVGSGSWSSISYGRRDYGGVKGGLKGGVTKVTGLTKLSHSHTTPFGTWLMGNAMGGLRGGG